MRRLAFTIVLSMALCPLAFSQDARSLLAAAARANGVAAQELLLLGTYTDASGNTNPLRVYIKGRDNLRFEIGTGSSQRVTMYSKGRGWTKTNKGVEALQEHSSARTATILPILDLSAHLENPRAAVTDRGQAVVKTRTAYHVTVQLPDQAAQRLLGRRLDDTVELYIDTNTLLVLRSERVRRSEENMDLLIPSVLEFSDYRVVGGMLIPFHVVNTLGNSSLGFRQSSVVLFSAEQTPLADSLFTPGGAQ